jgi:hypothetical protein
VSLDLASFKSIVDGCTDRISPIKGDLLALYAHFGIPLEGHYAQKDIRQELYQRIRDAFTSGHQIAWTVCRSLREQLIQREVMEGESPEPYFAILDAMLDALRSQKQIPGDIAGDWPAAIRSAFDFTCLGELIPSSHRQRVHARAYEVAKAAKQLQIGGIKLIRERENIYIEPASENRLVGILEKTIASMGGVNVCRRVFSQITSLYDACLERYHVVSRQEPSGGGRPQIPFGYILLLAAKHFYGTRPIKDTDQAWTNTCAIATGYATVLDVQNYTPTIWRVMDAAALVRYLREVAIYDTLFRLPQIRGSDVCRIARGILQDHDFSRPHGTGYSLNDVLAVVEVLMSSTKEQRGPVSFDLKTLSARCPGIDKPTLHSILDEVLTHPTRGPNQSFSKPTDAPAAENPNLGHDFFQRPLLSADGARYWMLDHSFCALPSLEAVLGMLRRAEKDFDASLTASRIAGKSASGILSDKFPSVPVIEPEAARESWTSAITSAAPYGSPWRTWRMTARSRKSFSVVPSCVSNTSRIAVLPWSPSRNRASKACSRSAKGEACRASTVFKSGTIAGNGVPSRKASTTTERTPKPDCGLFSTARNASTMSGRAKPPIGRACQ